MKIIDYLLGFTMVLAVVVIALLTSVDIVAFHDKVFYSKQYALNDVYSVVEINESDLSRVTDSLIDYMQGKKDELNLTVVISGEETEFFNQRELDHMKDVRNLIMGGMKVRTAAVLVVAACGAVLIFRKADIKRIISRAFTFGIPAITLFSAVLGYIISRDFTTAFIYFHEMLFTNDLWWLDPATDMLVNIVPEPFFMAMALKIGIIFVAVILIIFFVSVYFVVKDRKEKVHLG